MYFPNNRLWKTWLDHFLKTAVSELALTVNMWKLPKYLPNLHESTFIVFFHHSRGSWFQKYLPYCHVNSSMCFLTHWLPMASLLFKIVKIFNSHLKCSYLKKENAFSIVFTFLEATSNFNHFVKKDDRHSKCISEITECGKLG